MAESFSETPKEVAQPKEQPQNLAAESGLSAGAGKRDIAADDATVSGLGFPSGSDLLPLDGGAAAGGDMNKNAGMSLVTGKNGKVIESSTTNGENKETFNYRENGQLSRKTLEGPDGKETTDFGEDGSTTVSKFDKKGNPQSLKHEGLNGEKMNAQINKDGKMDFDYSHPKERLKGTLNPDRTFNGTHFQQQGIEQVQGRLKSINPMQFEILNRNPGRRA